MHKRPAQEHIDLASPRAFIVGPARPRRPDEDVFHAIAIEIADGYRDPQGIASISPIENHIGTIFREINSFRQRRRAEENVDFAGVVAPVARTVGLVRSNNQVVEAVAVHIGADDDTPQLICRVPTEDGHIGAPARQVYGAGQTGAAEKEIDLSSVGPFFSGAISVGRPNYEVSDAVAIEIACRY